VVAPPIAANEIGPPAGGGPPIGGGPAASTDVDDDVGDGIGGLLDGGKPNGDIGLGGPLVAAVGDVSIADGFRNRGDLKLPEPLPNGLIGTSIGDNVFGDDDDDGDCGGGKWAIQYNLPVLVSRRNASCDNGCLSCAQ
jgi:hypothetical protein